MTHATHWAKKNHRAETSLRSETRPHVRAHAVAGTRSRVEIISLVALLGATALLYLVGLSASGYANEFYSAAAQAGSTNWWSFLWGSSDAGNSITVDKPPAALWPMALSVKIFGLSSWSILVPQAIMGVLSVWLLYSTVRRTYGHWAGILAGTVLATTPIACLMFRFNNPDALLMLLLLACVYCVLRACELPDERAANRSRTRWMALAGVAMGFAFLTKQLQAFLILPGIGIAFLVTSPTGWRRKLLDTLAAFGALIVSAGWWVLLTVVVPADMRPYIGGSQTNSFIELTFSYNGLGRITGSMEGAVLPGGSSTTTTISQGQAGMWGQTGITRLFDGVWGTQWSWLAWVALAGIAVGIVCAVKDMRGLHGSHADSSDALDASSVDSSSSSINAASTEAGAGADVGDTASSPSLGHLKLAQVIIWGCWLVVTGLIFSFMGGTIHQYYTVALAPAVAALVAICVAELWQARGQLWALITACVLTGITAIWATVLLERSDWVWQLRPITLCLGVAAIVVMLVAWQRGHKKTAGANANTTVTVDANIATSTTPATDIDNATGIDTYPTVGNAYQTAAGATAREATNSDVSDAASSDIVDGLTMPVTTRETAHLATASLLDKVALGLALASALVSPVAYSLYTAATPHTGSIVTAGPSVQDDSGMGGGPGGAGGGMGGQGGPGQGGMGAQGNGQGGPSQMGTTDGNSGQQGGQSANGTMGGAPGMSQRDGTSSGSSSDSSSSTGSSNGTSSSNGTMPAPSNGTGDGTSSGSSSTSNGNGAMPTPPSSANNGTSTDSTSGNATSNDNSATGTDGTTGSAPTMGTAPNGTDSTGAQQGAQPGNGGEGGNGGGLGGLLGGSASSISDELVTALQKDADSYRWVAATVGSQNAASYQLASECSVMPIGGFNGSDPSPTLEQFKEWVAAGKIHYFIASGGMGGGTQIGGSDYASQITSWVEENFTSTTIGNVTVYDLTQSAS